MYGSYHGPVFGSSLGHITTQPLWRHVLTSDPQEGPALRERPKKRAWDSEQAINDVVDLSLPNDYAVITLLEPAGQS